MSSRWFQVRRIHRIQTLLRSKWTHPTAAVLTLLFLLPVAALAQNSPFDTGFTAIQSLFTGTIAKVASLVAIVIGGYDFAHGDPSHSTQVLSPRQISRSDGQTIGFDITTGGRTILTGAD